MSKTFLPREHKIFTVVDDFVTCNSKMSLGHYFMSILCLCVLSMWFITFYTSSIIASRALYILGFVLSVFSFSSVMFFIYFCTTAVSEAP